MASKLRGKWALSVNGPYDEAGPALNKSRASAVIQARASRARPRKREAELHWQLRRWIHAQHCTRGSSSSASPRLGAFCWGAANRIAASSFEMKDVCGTDSRMLH